MYDAIVVGLGGMGTATLYHLARKGARVLGVEQFGVAHDRGSSHGQTRLIRMAYFEHADYVPLLRESFAAWDDLCAATGQDLFVRTGLALWGSPEGGEVLPGTLASAEKYAIPLHVWDHDEARRQLPLHRAPEGFRCAFEPGAGFLRVEACVQAHVDQARALGATVVDHAIVRNWRPDGAGVAVEFNGQTVHAAQLVLTTGAWSGPVLRELGADLTVHRNALVWLRSSQAHSLAAGAPCFGFALPTGFFYGFPALDDRGLKAALHLPGDRLADPALVERARRPTDTAPVVDFAAACLPEAGPEVTDSAVCLYEMSPDGHFVVDRHPRWPQVLIAGGFSGHGFKFAPAMGRVLADAALGAPLDPAVGFLSAARFVQL